MVEVVGYTQWCIAKNGGGYTQRGVAKGLKVPCLFMIAEVSIRCQKNPGGWYTPYIRVYPPIHHWLYRARQLLFINKRLRARSSLNSSFTRQRVPTALSALRPILFRCKICKLNTLSVTKHYAEQSAGKCTVFQSLRM